MNFFCQQAQVQCIETSMEALEKEVMPPDWHCYACDARVAQSSIGYSYPTREPQCSCCGRFGFLEPLTNAEPVPQMTRTQSESSNGLPSYFTAEISAVALPLELPVSQPSTCQDGFRITFDGLDMPLTRESAPNESVEPSQLTETQIIAFDLSQPRPLQNSTNQSSNALEQQFSDVYNALIEYLEPLDDMTVNTMYHEVFGLDTNSESRGTWLQAVADLPRIILSEPSTEGPCAICQEDFKIGDAVTPLCPDKQRCAHTFHSSCIIPWLKEHNSCPVCRYELPADSEEYERRKKKTLEPGGSANISLSSERSASSSSSHPSSNE